MTTELSFLIELLLNHKLPPATKKLIAERVKEVEGSYSTTSSSISIVKPATFVGSAFANQSPSMQAIMARNPDLVVAPQVVEQIAQTPITQAALASRDEVIKKANSAGPFSGKPEAGRTSPRKF